MKVNLYVLGVGLPGVDTLIWYTPPSITLGALYVIDCAPDGYADIASTVGIVVVDVGNETRYVVWFGVKPAKLSPLILISFKVLSESNATLKLIVYVCFVLPSAAVTLICALPVGLVAWVISTTCSSSCFSTLTIGASVVP